MVRPWRAGRPCFIPGPQMRGPSWAGGVVCVRQCRPLQVDHPGAPGALGTGLQHALALLECGLGVASRFSRELRNLDFCESLIFFSMPTIFK